MPIGVALIDLRRDLRAETGQSLNPAQGVQSQATQDNQLDRQQRELWEQYDWPHLRYWVDKPAIAGQTDYDYPDEMPFDSINRIFWSDGSSNWKTLTYGLHAFDIQPVPLDAEDPTQYIPRGTPSRWGNKISVTEGKTDPLGKLTVLPTPSPAAGKLDGSPAGILRFEGQAPCTPLIADDDKCIIDSKAIVLFAAAEILAVQKVEAAQLKLMKAQNYLRRILAQQGADKRANYNMGGNTRIDHFGARPYRNAVPGIDYIP